MIEHMLEKILGSWSNCGQPFYSTDELLAWINEQNNSATVCVDPCRLSDSEFWSYDQDKGAILNRNQSFFSIYGIRKSAPPGTLCEQPIIVQKEIGFLGILCKEINGTLHFLMQAKIEPGNINKVQVSPTLQATKSNFTQKHGGNPPAYLEYFLSAGKHQILVDQIQSEQSSRFYKKRNRNIILLLEDEVTVLPNYRWMTLGQIKQFMRCNNLVNMDTRTVLSCIPLSLVEDKGGMARRYFSDQSLYRSFFNKGNASGLVELFHCINDYKMLSNTNTQLIRLDELQNWEMDDFGIRCCAPYSFSVIYCDIEIEGREVRHWSQQLFKAEGSALFGLYSAVIGGTRYFLVRLQPEVGCFDRLELGPTLQREAVCFQRENEIDLAFTAQYGRKERILYDVFLSEEGGRFYHEQNHNIILETDYFEPPDGYFWMDYRTLNLFTQFNNYVNIQLRSLLSLLEVL